MKRIGDAKLKRGARCVCVDEATWDFTEQEEPGSDPEPEPEPEAGLGNKLGKMQIRQ